MNKMTRAVIGIGSAISSVGVCGGFAGAETIPNDCRVFEVGYPVSRSSENTLITAGFSGIEADGIVTSSQEQLAVYIAQLTLKRAGALSDSTRICGYAGAATKNAAQIFIDAEGSSLDSHKQRPKNPTSDISIEDCRRYNEYTKDSIIAVQKALGAYPDGMFGNASCRVLIEFQRENGILPSELGALGPKTAKLLGVELIKISDNTFNPAADCPKPESCDIRVDLTKQQLVVVDDGGRVLWQIPIQSGKKGKETRTGSGKLGPVEYGPDKNPERQSRDYPEAILVNARSFGNGNQKLHGSYSYNPNAVNRASVGSAGCIRLPIEASFILAKMMTGTDVSVTGAKPGTTHRYFS